MGLDQLRRIFPWPEECPDVPGDGESFFETSVVVELGCWLGGSTRWILKRCPNATVISVDTFRGNPGYAGDPHLAAKLPTLQQTFYRNQWESRDRVIVLPMTSIRGLAWCFALDISPEVIFVDACHRFTDVITDVRLAHELFPGARLVGDDCHRREVRRAVESVAADLKLEWRQNRQGWIIDGHNKRV
jgi:hypothetical protein